MKRYIRAGRSFRTYEQNTDEWYMEHEDTITSSLNDILKEINLEVYSVYHVGIGIVDPLYRYIKEPTLLLKVSPNDYAPKSSYVIDPQYVDFDSGEIRYLPNNVLHDIRQKYDKLIQPKINSIPPELSELIDSIDARYGLHCTVGVSPRSKAVKIYLYPVPEIYSYFANLNGEEYEEWMRLSKLSSSTQRNIKQFIKGIQAEFEEVMGSPVRSVYNDGDAIKFEF